MHKATRLGSRAAAGTIPPHLVAAVGFGISTPEGSPSNQEPGATSSGYKLLAENFSTICVLIFILNPESVLCLTVCVCVPFLFVGSSVCLHYSRQHWEDG